MVWVREAVIGAFKGASRAAALFSLARFRPIAGMPALGRKADAGSGTSNRRE